MWMIVETTSTFDYRAVHEWVIQMRKKKDPKTQEPFQNPDPIRNVSLMRDIRKWCKQQAAALREENVRLEVAALPEAGVGDGDRASMQVHVFVDYSNLFGRSRARGAANHVNICKVVRLIHASRRVEQRVIVGSANSSEEEWARWRDLGYDCIVDPRKEKRL